MFRSNAFVLYGRLSLNIRGGAKWGAVDYEFVVGYHFFGRLFISKSPILTGAADLFEWDVQFFEHKPCRFCCPAGAKYERRAVDRLQVL